MATETKELLRIPIENVKNLGELRDNIKLLKKDLDGLEVGSQEYNDTLKELQVNQNALKNAMHATSAEGKTEATTMESISKAAKGVGNSYNALVKRMADLTQEFRSTEDVVRRTALAKEIKDINEELKRMDAARGIYSRNVGDYFNQIFPGLQKVNDGLHLVGKQPILGLITLLAPVIVKIADGLKENETALGAIDKLLSALEPVADFFAGILETIAGWLGQAVDWLVSLGKNSSLTFNKIVAGATGVGNALLQFLLTPIRTVIDAAKGIGEVFKKIFQGDFKGAAAAAKEAGKNIGDNFKKGFSFKENFKTGQQVGEDFAAGLKSNATKKAVQTAAKEIKKVAENALKDVDLSRLDNFIDPAIKARIEAEKAAAAEEAEILDYIIGQEQEATAEIDAIWEEFEQQQMEQRAREAELQKQRIDALYDAADATASIFDTLADIYEANDEADEKATQKAKALRTASAIITTISGAIAAYMNTIESIKIPQIAIPLAGLNAASVLAAGYAQVKQINAVKVGSGASASASVPAPAVTPVVAQVRAVTGQSEEDRLNRMASDQKVYLVVSELEAKQDDMKVRVQEANF